MIWIMIISFFIMIFLGVPIAFAMGASALFFILIEGIPLSTMAQQFFSNTQSFAFLAVPFFILAGSLMVQGGIAQRIIELANTMVRHLPGGLANVSVITSMGMAGVSGSSVADAASVGSVLIPEMKRKKYPGSFAAALNAATSVVGIIIPPSSTMIIIAWLANLSVADMFLAGAIPGILLGLSFLAVTIIISMKRGYPKEPRANFKEFLDAFRRSFWALLLPIFLISVIVFGIATATEAAALSAIYAFIISLLVYRSLGLRGTFKAVAESVYSTTIIMMIVCSSAIFSWVLISEGIPQLISNFLLSLGASNWMLVLILIFVMLVFGLFIDNVPNLFIFIPIFMPIAIDLGIDPIQFSIVMLMSFALGLFTPPVGTTLFISLHLAKVKVEETVKDIIPYFVIGVVIIFLIAFIPSLTLWLPSIIDQ